MSEKDNWSIDKSWVEFVQNRLDNHRSSMNVLAGWLTILSVISLLCFYKLATK